VGTGRLSLPFPRSRPRCSGVFGESFGVTFDPQPLRPQEQTLLKNKLPYFSSRDYVFKVRNALPRRKTLSSIFKAPGGLIRVSMAVDTKTRVINQILITGDFFAHPKRLIFDLECLLRIQRQPLPASVRWSQPSFRMENRGFPGSAKIT